MRSRSPAGGKPTPVPQFQSTGGKAGTPGGRQNHTSPRKEILRETSIEISGVSHLGERPGNVKTELNSVPRLHRVAPRHAFASGQGENSADMGCVLIRRRDRDCSRFQDQYDCKTPMAQLPAEACEEYSEVAFIFCFCASFVLDFVEATRWVLP